MKTYARLVDDVVAELHRAEDGIADRFHPDLVWIDATAHDGVAEGWRRDGETLVPPPPLPVRPAAPTVAELEVRLQELQQLIAALPR